MGATRVAMIAGGMTGMATTVLEGTGMATMPVDLELGDAIDMDTIPMALTKTVWIPPATTAKGSIRMIWIERDITRKPIWMRMDTTGTAWIRMAMTGTATTRWALIATVIPTQISSLMKTASTRMASMLKQLDGSKVIASMKSFFCLDAELELDESVSSATLVGEVTSDGYDVPTTVAQLGDDLWAVNARFGTEVTPETEYWMTRVDAPMGMDE